MPTDTRCESIDIVRNKNLESIEIVRRVKWFFCVCVGVVYTICIRCLICYPFRSHFDIERILIE